MMIIECIHCSTKNNIPENKRKEKVKCGNCKKDLVENKERSVLKEISEPFHKVYKELIDIYNGKAEGTPQSLIKTKTRKHKTEKFGETTVNWGTRKKSEKEKDVSMYTRMNISDEDYYEYKSGFMTKEELRREREENHVRSGSNFFDDDEDF